MRRNIWVIPALALIGLALVGLAACTSRDKEFRKDFEEGYRRGRADAEEFGRSPRANFGLVIWQENELGWLTRCWDGDLYQVWLEEGRVSLHVDYSSIDCEADR